MRRCAWMARADIILVSDIGKLGIIGNMGAGGNTYRQVEQRALSIVPELLAELSGDATRTVAASELPETGNFTVYAGDRAFVVVAMSSSRTSIVDAAIAHLERIGAQSADAVALLVVPYMGPSGAERCRVRNVSWLDLSGNADIAAPGFRVHVEGKANRFPERGRPSTPFAPAGMRVARALLQDPSRWRAARDLAEVTRLPAGTVSKTLARLQELKLVERDAARRVRTSDADLLLDSWAADYQFHLHRVTTWHAPLNAGVEVAKVISQRLTASKIDHAATGLAAAWLYDDGHTNFRTSSLYVTGNFEDSLRELGLQRVDRGANLRLIEPADPGVLQFGETIDTIPCVSMVQTYVDLPHDGERATDAATHLRERGLW